MDLATLERINIKRRHKGLPPLTCYQAQTAVASHPSRSDDGFDTTGFLIGYMTGIPMPSAGGIIGAMMHDSGSHHSSSPSSAGSDSFSGGGGSYSGAGASGSWDSGSSSSSSSSDSSSSYSSSSDSGSSSSGGGE